MVLKERERQRERKTTNKKGKIDREKKEEKISPLPPTRSLDRPVSSRPVLFYVSFFILGESKQAETRNDMRSRVFGAVRCEMKQDLPAKR